MLFRSLLLTAFAAASHAEPISMQGSALFAQMMKIAEPIIKEELGLELRVGTEGGSSGGFLSVGTGTSQLGLITKPLEAADRAQFPARSAGRCSASVWRKMCGMPACIRSHAIKW